ncbi:FUSC family protein [Streptosporangium vulgare]|uniref:FUSC family protein n=1 Tax=Streptosporangium vulgare TaxID=46190 RepID=UPI0031DB6CDB
MPPLFRRAADRLTDAAPGWLVETVRPAPAPLRWWPMLRLAVAVTVPLLLGFVSGNVTTGLLPALGAMNAGIADRGGSYRARIVLMGAAGVAGALGYLVGSMVRGHGWWIVPVVVAVSVVSAFVSTGGATGSAAGLQLLVMTVIATGIGLPGASETNALAFLLGVLWVIVLAVADWPFHPRAPERGAVMEVYQALDRLFSDRDAPALAAFDTDLKRGYDVVLGARSPAAGLDADRTRLVALLNQASLIRNALLSLRYEGREPPAEAASAVRAVAGALAGGPAPRMPPCELGSPAARALCSAVRGAVELVSGGDVAADQLPYEPVGYRSRALSVLEQMWRGHLVRVYTVRLALCMGVAAAFSASGRLERSYWMMLTVALVLKPDFGSVFVRAVQRALGTFVGALIGTLLLVLVPYGPLLLVPIAVCAALMPYGLQRNWGLMSTFQASLVLLLVGPADPRRPRPGQDPDGGHADRMRDRPGAGIPAVAGELGGAGRAAARRRGGGHRELPAARVRHGTRRQGAAAPRGVRRPGRPADGLPAGPGRTSRDQPTRHHLDARDGSAGTGGRRDRRHRRVHRARRAAAAGGGRMDAGGQPGGHRREHPGEKRPRRPRALRGGVPGTGPLRGPWPARHGVG